MIARRALLISALWGAIYILPASAQQSSIPIEIVPINPHSSSVTTVAFSRDGRIVLSQSNEVVKLWDVKTGRLVRSFFGRTDQIFSAALAPDGQTVAIADKEKTLLLRDTASGATIRSFTGHSQPIFSVAFSPDGQQIATGSYDKTIKLWETSTGRLLRTLTGHASHVMALKFSADGSRLLSRDGGNSKAILWDIASGQQIRTFSYAGGGVGAIALSADGTVLTAGGDTNPTVKLWNATSGQLLRNVDVPKGVTSIAVFGAYAVSGGVDNSVKIWRLDNGTVQQTLKGHSNAVWSVAFSADGALALSGSADATIKLWNVADGRLVRTFSGLTDRVNTVAFSPDGTHALSGSGPIVKSETNDNTMKYWDVAVGQLIHISPRHQQSVNSVAFAPDGTQLLSADSAGGLKLWDTAGRLIRNFPGETEGDGAQFSQDGTRILRASGTRLTLLETASSKPVRAFTAKSISHVVPYVFSPILSHDGSKAVAGNSDGSVKIWNTSNGQLERTLRHQVDASASSVAISRDGSRLLSGGGPLKLWATATGQLIRTFGEGSPIAISPDGTRALSANADSAIKLWNIGTGELVRAFASQRALVNSVAFSPDGGRIISGNEDGTFKIWSVISGELIASFTATASGEWLVLTPEGFFNASPNAGGLLSIVQGLEVYSIDQVYQSLYRPDLVREKLAGDPRDLVREAAAQLDLGKVIGSGNVPGLAMLSPLDGAPVATAQIAAEAEITDRGGGIGRVEWRVNGVTVGIEAPPAPSAGQPLRFTRNLSLDPGNNTIEVVAYNSANLVAAVPVRASVILPATPAAPGQVATAQQPRLFVIAAGLDEYADSRFKLGGSVRDAQALAKAFAASGAGLYRNVEVKLLTNADVSKDKLDAAFKEFSTRASPSDVFVLYLAGHGKTVNGRYYFIPRDFNVGANADEKAIDAAVVTQGIAQEQWQRWFASIPARKSVILFDTCESGTLTGAAAGTKTLEQSAANDRLAQATGRSIITASSGTQVAFEGYRGHGLFTYNLLDALERADSDGNGTIEISELATYVYSQVTTLSEQVFKKRQEPQIRIASSYPLTKQGRVLAGDFPTLAQDASPTYQLAQTADLQIKPGNGATIVRSLSAKTSVTVLKSEGGWSLIASGGKPLGYVATRDLARVQ